MRFLRSLLCSCSVIALVGCASTPVETEEPSDDFGELFGVVHAASPVPAYSLPESRADWLEIVRIVSTGEIDEKVLIAMTKLDEMPDDLNTSAFQNSFRLSYKIYLEGLIKKAGANEVQPLQNRKSHNDIWQRMLNETADCGDENAFEIR